MEAEGRVGRREKSLVKAASGRTAFLSSRMSQFCRLLMTSEINWPVRCESFEDKVEKAVRIASSGCSLQLGRGWGEALAVAAWKDLRLKSFF